MPTDNSHETQPTFTGAELERWASTTGSATSQADRTLWSQAQRFRVGRRLLRITQYERGRMDEIVVATRRFRGPFVAASKAGA